MYAAEHGGDLSRTAMVAFGGGGPLHAVAVARKLGIARILVPESAGVFSALGFLTAPPTFEVARSVPSRMAETAPEDLAAQFEALAEEADAVVRAAAPGARIERRRYAEMRYVGQGHELRVRLEGLSREEIAAAFAAAYRSAYGYAYDDLEPEIVTLRLVSEAVRPDLRPAGGAAEAGGGGERMAWDPGAQAMVPHRVVPFAALDRPVEGPALLAQGRRSCWAAAPRAPGGWLEIRTGVAAEAAA